MMEELNIILILAGFIAGAAVGAMLMKKTKINIEDAKNKAEKIIASAKTNTEENIKKAKKQTEEMRTKIEEGIKTYEEFLKDIEKSIKIKEDLSVKWDKKIQDLKLQEAAEEGKLSMAESKHKEIQEKYIRLLTQKAGKSTEELKEEIIQKLDEDLKKIAEEKLKKLEEYYKENADKWAKNILFEAMQKISTPTSTEKKSVQIHVPKDSLKAELVGKNAENIKELESLLDVNVVFNDFPDTISISSYNLLNRRIAEIAIEKLFKSKKRITQSEIKETVKAAKAEAEKDVYKLGIDAIKKLGIKRPMPQDLVRIIGRLYFRTSYGQNIIKHSMEVAYAANLLGGELGLNTDICKIGGFLHDLGKAIDQDPGISGGHDQLTKELMEKYGFTQEEVHAAWTHHEAEKPNTPEAMIVKAADAISAGRPGARQESIDRYLERIQTIEKIPAQFEGVKKTFAISAGREVRVMADPQILKDEQLMPLAQNIAKAIEEEAKYPGKIKINVIRKITNVEYTK